ncbi:syntaxin-11a [Cottoperca gobio]|uniref:Syntaxin-11a n=1 Tax=Cottoperca gobio TaxID=56716 RepID=A0A6J2PBJ4_COTGO|nr:syntaxin-11-like [Cottoperca gobio]
MLPGEMRDRLCELQTHTFGPAEEQRRPEEDQQHTEEDEEHHVVVFEGEDVMDDIYKEAQAMRKEMLLLKLDVKRLGKQNSRFLTSVRRISSIKRDSNALGRGIKARGEAVYARLEKLGKLSKELEEEHGPTSAVARMVRSQCISLNGAFHDAISEYNEAEMIQRENCKTRIQRQAEIMGKEVSREQIDEMIETGKWNVFSDNLLLEGRSARSALNEMENRHKELLELEGRIRGIHELFSQMAQLVEEQGCMLDNIEANVGATQDYVLKATGHIKKAVKYQKDNPCRKLCCCCCCCQ